MSPSSGAAPTRAVVVHVLMVGGYILAVLVAFLLVAAPLLEWMVLGRLDPAVLAAVVVGAVLFRVVVPDPVRFEPAGPLVERDAQPELFEILDMVASALRQPMPEEVYLLDEMNAYVAEIGGLFGVGSRRVVGIGVPLMSVLDPEEFGAVVAHEFGHLNRGAGRIGAMVYMTRQAVVRQVIDAPATLLQRPLMAYARLYLRATAPTARAQELGADALAARATSTKAVAGALARLPFGTVAYGVYHRTEYLPLLTSGRRPPLLDGFETFLTSSVAREHLPSSGDAALGSSTGSSLDAHPPVAERLSALGVPPADVEERPLPAVRATALLRDADQVEATLAAGHLDEGARLVPIGWDDVGTEVLVPRWRRDREALVGELPEGFHLGALPLDGDGLAELGTDVAQHSGKELDGDALVAQGHRAARAIIGEMAVDRGLDVEMVPGEPVWFGRPPEQFGLFAAYDAVVDGRDAPETWFDLLDEAGLTDPSDGVVAPVSEPVAASGASPSEAPARSPARRPVPTPPDDEPRFRAPAFVTAALTSSVTTARTPSPPSAAQPSEHAGSLEKAGSLDAAGSSEQAGSSGEPPTPRRQPVPSDSHRRKVFRIPAGMGRHHDLILDGDTISYRDQTIDADDVTHVAYWSGDDAEVRLWVGDQVMRIRLAGGQKAKDVHAGAWEALVAWIDARVAQRLVQRALARIAERGRVQVGDQTVTATGVVIRGRVVPWAVLIGASLDGREIHLHQRTEGDAAGTVVATLDASEPNIVLVPPLMVAASASATESTGVTS